MTSLDFTTAIKKVYSLSIKRFFNIPGCKDSQACWTVASSSGPVACIYENSEEFQNLIGITGTVINFSHAYLVVYEKPKYIH